MEAHPVPQNVTNFEFHLIGDMTIKQFGYLFAGMAVAYLLFVLLATPLPLIAWPLIVFFALSGIAFAFFPISERPLDHWVGAYFKAIFQPTQRIWSTKNKKVADPSFKNRLNLYLNSMNRDTFKEQSPNLAIISQMAPRTQTIVNQPAAVPVPEKKEVPSSQDLEKTVDLAKEAQGIQNQIVETEKELNQIKVESAAPGEDTSKYTQDFQKVLGELQGLTKEASEISAQMAEHAHIEPQAAIKTVVPALKQQSQTNIVLTSTPNIINGIVTDALNNYMEGVIVVTHDKQGLPVRALKSNKLGQFVAATPLPNGVYTLSLEKDNLNFDNTEISLDGKVMPPIVVSPKKGVV